MNIESMVRDTLHSHADGAPPNAGLVAGARARAGRRRARRALVGATAGAAVGLLALAIPYGIPLTGRGPDVPGSGPPSVALAEASFELPSFPFTPGWTPAGIGSPHVSLSFWSTGLSDGTATYSGPEGSEVEFDARRIFPQLTLVHPAGPDEFGSPLQVEIYSAEPDRLFESLHGEPITVHGRPGTRYVGEEGNVMILWEHEPDLWVRVWAAADIAPEDVERYARGLEETPQPGEAPVTFEVLPIELEVVDLGADEIRFEWPDEGWLEVTITWDEQVVGPIDYSPPPTASPPADPSASVPADPSASAPVDPSAYPSAPPPVPIVIEVNGRTAVLLEWSDGTSVDIPLDQQPWILSVSGSLNREDLLTIAEGIELEPWARPFGQPSQPR